MESISRTKGGKRNKEKMIESMKERIKKKENKAVYTAASVANVGQGH